MKVSIFGLGYVGCVNLGCLAKSGFEVIGVDAKPEKVSKISSGCGTIVEEGIDCLIREHKSKITSTIDSFSAIQNTDISLICVGTPPDKDGTLNLSYIWAVAAEIGEALKQKKRFHVIAIRSTVLPGTCEKFITILEATSGKVEGRDFEVIHHPEFLREGNAVHDYFHPGKIVFGTLHKESTALTMMKQLYSDIEAPTKIVDIKTSEMIKYINNSWHALKIAFTNECSSICREYEINSQEVMKLFCSDQKLNLSSAYMKPGFAYGGYCLPKDLQGLVSMGKQREASIPVLSSIAKSNSSHIFNIGEWICSFKEKNILMLGLSFKEKTDDIRFSPKIDLAQYLLSQGKTVSIYDQNINLSIKKDINKKYIEKQLGSLANLLIESPNEVLGMVDIIVIANKEKEHLEFAQKFCSTKILLELTDTGIEDALGYAWESAKNRKAYGI